MDIEGLKKMENNIVSAVREILRYRQKSLLLYIIGYVNMDYLRIAAALLKNIIKNPLYEQFE